MNTINKVDERTWENPYKVKEDVQEWIIDVAENHGQLEKGNVSHDLLYDSICEIIDHSEYVIYTYQAKRITEVYEIDPFSKSEVTGENYKSFNEMAYEVLHDMAIEYITKNYPNIEL